MTSLVNGYNLSAGADASASRAFALQRSDAKHRIRESMRAKNTDPVLQVILVDVKYAILLDLALTILSYFDSVEIHEQSRLKLD